MYLFGDSFDLYAAPADAIAGYWDSGNLQFTLGAGRFAGSQAIVATSTASATAAVLQKASGSNDSVHHIVFAVTQSAAITGSSNLWWFTFMDGATAQCSVVVRSDGAILLVSGATGGTTLATYTGALTASNTWFAFEVEIIINNTTGSFAVRKNGNTSNDFSAGSLNTRGGTANNYANVLKIGNGQSTNSQSIDDLLWRSDAASVPFVGDVRCFTRRPVSDAAVQWTPNAGGTNYTQVDETQQNAATDYVFSSTVGQSDLYGISSISSTPASIVAVTTRAFCQKSDAGTRNAAVQLKSGGTTVQGASTALSSSGWGWLYRTDTLDPDTGLAWSAIRVNNCNIGCVVTA